MKGRTLYHMVSRTVLICMMLLVSAGLRAQLCQGSLGDPIVNINFGSGADPGPALSAAATGYQYIAADCPDDGFYTLRTRTANCFANSWFTVNADHTGNGGGYFMLVNASIQPSEFYLDTVRGLCGNTNYEFASWVMNVIRPEACMGSTQQPNLTFSIERTNGAVLQTYNTGNIPPLSGPLWKQYGFFFTTPAATTDVVLRIRNNAAGGCGNDLALDDITFRPCGPLILPSILSETSRSVVICEGQSRSFAFSCNISGGFTNPAFTWQQSTNGGAWTDLPGAASANLTRSFSPTTPVGTYAFRLVVAEAGNLSSTQCRIASDPLTITITANPVAIASNDGPACQGTAVILAANGGDAYTWTGPGNFAATGSSASINNIQPLQAGPYDVVVTNSYGCVAAASTTVSLLPSPSVATGLASARICEGDSITLTAISSDSIWWEPVTGLSQTSGDTTTASPTVSTIYQAIVSNSFLCRDTASVSIEVQPAPVANAGVDKTILTNEKIRLTGTVTGSNTRFNWNDSPFLDDELSLVPLVNPPSDFSFVLNAISLDGCGTDSDTVNVYVFDDVFVPNAFSPNADGVNDQWVIRSLDALKLFDLYVFNRYGEIVFQSSNTNRAWDGKTGGKNVPAGTYVYSLDLKNRGVRKGTVTIIR